MPDPRLDDVRHEGGGVLEGELVARRWQRDGRRCIWAHVDTGRVVARIPAWPDAQGWHELARAPIGAHVAIAPVVSGSGSNRAGRIEVSDAR